MLPGSPASTILVKLFKKKLHRIGFGLLQRVPTRSYGIGDGFAWPFLASGLRSVITAFVRASVLRSLRDTFLVLFKTYNSRDSIDLFAALVWRYERRSEGACFHESGLALRSTPSFQ